MMHLMESLFDIAYLGVVIALGIRLLFENSKDAKQYGLMAIILGIGDGFHLMPRVVSHLTVNGFEKYSAALSWGECITSITMTLFYLLFFWYYCKRSGDENKNKRILIYLLVVVRVILVVLPQNLWGRGGNYMFSILRNIPFALIGLLLIYWTWKHRKKEGLEYTSILITTSFLCYLPVVLGARFIPTLGMLMIPKTIAYVLLVVVGYRYFIRDFKASNLLKIAATFLILALAGGVFFREFTKAFKWHGDTTLSVVHVHLMSLGFMLFAILYAILQLVKQGMNKIKVTMIVYNVGLCWTVVTFMVRGIYTITSNQELIFKDAALAGMAGLGHCILAVGLVWLVINVVQIKMQKSMQVD